MNYQDFLLLVITKQADSLFSSQSSNDNLQSASLNPDPVTLHCSYGQGQIRSEQEIKEVSMHSIFPTIGNDKALGCDLTRRIVEAKTGPQNGNRSLLLPFDRIANPNQLDPRNFMRDLEG